MNLELKRAILTYILDNAKYMNLTNQTVDHFKAYVYDSEGEHLIGGEQVYEFIREAVKLIEGSV